MPQIKHSFRFLTLYRLLLTSYNPYLVRILMNWEKIKLKNFDGEWVEAQAPIIISVSRSTDIPAFYSDWLLERIKVGYIKWKNPFNGVVMYVSFAKVRLAVFWSKIQSLY